MRNVSRIIVALVTLLWVLSLGPVTTVVTARQSIPPQIDARLLDGDEALNRLHASSQMAIGRAVGTQSRESQSVRAVPAPDFSEDAYMVITPDILLVGQIAVPLVLVTCAGTAEVMQRQRRRPRYKALY